MGTDTPSYVQITVLVTEDVGVVVATVLVARLLQLLSIKNWQLYIGGMTILYKTKARLLSFVKQFLNEIFTTCKYVVKISFKNFLTFNFILLNINSMTHNAV